MQQPAAVVLLAGLALVPLLQARVPQTIPLEPGGTVAVENVHGSIIVEGWDQPVVEVVALEPYDSGNVEIEITAEPDAVRIRTRYPATTDEPPLVDYFLRVPRQVALEALRTVNGNIRIERIEGQIQAYTINGEIELNDVSGAVTARSVNGTIGAALRGVADQATPVHLETVNGDVWLGLMPRVAAEVQMTTVAGEIDSEFPLVAAGGDASQRVRLRQGGPRLRLATVRGNVHLFEVSDEL